MSFKSLASVIKAGVSKHSTAITVSVSVAGYLVTTIMAITETRNFDARIEELKISKDGEPLTKKEVAATAVKSYWPAATVFAVSTASLIFGQRYQYRKTMELASAYQMTEKAFNAYKKEVEKTITSKKQEDVEKTIDQQKASVVTKQQIDVAEETGHGTVLCMERWTGRMFYSDPVYLEKIFNEFNADYVTRSIASLNELLYAWGLNTSTDSIGERLGWRLDALGEALSFYTNSTLTADNIPVLVVGTRQFPQFDFTAFSGF